jgi:GT2 family glycosyltransferase
MYFEDLDYCRRVNSMGLKVYYLPDVHLIHVHGASGKAGVNTLLIESSKKYFGIVRYYLYTFVLWFGQKYGTN